MLVELIAVGAALGVGGVMAAWQYALARRRYDVPESLSEKGPYRHGATPGAVVDPQTGGYPMPPSFEEDGYTPKT